MKTPGRLLAVVLGLLLAPPVLSQSQSAGEEDAVFLVANPRFRDAEYRQTVLLASPTANGGHVGVIINRPTKRTLASLFPEHEPSKKVVDPVFFGGPFSASALVAIVRGDKAPGAGSLPMMTNMFLAFNVATIDRVIEERPNDARFFVGYVGWRPGELRQEIDRGLWFVLNPDASTVFRKNTDGLWEEMVKMAQRISAEAEREQTSPAIRLD